MRTVIIADWLPTFGGAEHVVATLHRMYPDAPIFTTVARRGRLPELSHADIRLSRLQFPFSILRTHTVLLPWMPRAVESMDLRGSDLIFSSSHAVGKGVIPPSDAVHICYCHTPVRYGWEMEDAYLKDFRVPRLLTPMVRNMLMRLRRWDMTAADRVDVFIANSRTTQERIRRIYGRESVVIHPPVGERMFGAKIDDRRPQDRAYFLALGRLVPYKRFDLLVATANRLRLPLKIAGTGSDFKRLKKLAGPTVDMLGFIPDESLPKLYAQARAFLFPQIEDAGVAALEAMACGTPVIALGKGGALDTVAEGATGVFFSEQSEASLTSAINDYAKIHWNPAEIRAHAEQFREQHFRSNIRSVVDRALQQYGKAHVMPAV